MNENHLKETPIPAEAAAAEPASAPENGKEKLSRKERKARWKAAKAARRQELEDYYRYAPWTKRVWNLCLKGPIKGLLTLGIVLGLIGVILVNVSSLYESLVIPLIREHYMNIRNRPLSEDQIRQIYEASPIDEEGYARIEALPSAGAEDTWTVCVYFVASDLEDNDQNDLSYTTTLLTREKKQEKEAMKNAGYMGRLNRYNGELAENGLELPSFFYYPEPPVAASSTVVTKDVVVSDRLGAASADIMELTSGVWSKNIQIVIQTGGATHWSNDMVNPNRTQRFLFKDGKFTEVANLPLQPAAEPETLADFLRFCRENYHSDHNMLILWDHGGGPFGYGVDSIYGSMLSLRDIRSALQSVYSPSETRPAFDIIGFDACLMSCLEVTNTLDGFADYYCLSEESIPGDGWDYGPWLQAMTDDPTMSPAKVCREIADSYTDYYMIQNINVPLYNHELTFSVIDAHKADELYDAYSALAEEQLKDAAGDLGVLAEIGRCGRYATRYGFSDYNVFNLVDLGNYVDYMIDSYPEACARIKELIGETVLYHRENGAFGDSTGIAVYIPTEVSNVGGLLYYLDYVYNICDSDSVRALYYYKQAGCLNGELAGYVATLTDTKPQVLDTAPFTRFSRAEPGFDAEGFFIPVDDRLQSLMSVYELELGCYDEEENAITYYGQDQLLNLDGEGRLCGEFDGTWICLDGEPLYVELVSASASAVEYMAHVDYDGSEAYLILSCSRDTGSFTINGLRLVHADKDPNLLASSRNRIEPEAGKRITPIYEQTDYDTGETAYISGDSIVFGAGTRITREMLPEGYYLSTAVISDSRGDHYYSRVLGATLSGKTVKDWTEDERFFGRDY